MTENTEPIIIEIEQAINPKDDKNCLRSALSGLEYAKFLRRVKKYKNPIIFTSFLPENALSAQILGAMGHGYLQLPYSKQALEAKKNEINALTDIQLEDIIFHFCQSQSAIRESFHDFQTQLSKINGTGSNYSDKKEHFRIEFEAYRTLLVKETGSHVNHKKVMEEYDNIVHKCQTENSIESVLNMNHNILSRYLPNGENVSDQASDEEKSWKVLFLDDNPDVLQPIFDVSNNRRIRYQIATSCQEAKETIMADIHNQIAVVVADFRLHEQHPLQNQRAPKKMQPEQGYDFLIWLSQKQDRYNAMVALSRLSKSFLISSFRKKQINVKVYSKVGLSASSALLFVDDLDHLGTQSNEVINNQPKASLWTKPQYDKVKNTIKNNSLKPYYIYHRNHNDYLTNENWINQQAEKVAREVEFAIDKSSNFNFAALVSIQGNLTKTLTGEIEKGYPDFLLKLLQRRVFYYLLLKGFERDAIVKMLHKGDVNSVMTEVMIRIVPNALAVQTETDIPYHLLVEEKHFLHHYMQLPIYSMAEMMDQTYSIINAVLTKSLKKNKAVTTELKNYCFEDEGAKHSF